ncbi:MAG: DUF1700 domain-containing protein [Lachnospiraceae bacterium]|nr:DUF1700 domain-containing protein [Lachnospiraceae bacterium]
MTKAEFIDSLIKNLNGLSEEDIKKSKDYYEEIIDDRMEDGIPEEDAVGGLGSIDEIKDQILTDVPITKIVKERMKPKRALKAWEIVLLILGSPVWIPVLAAVIVVLLVLYLCFWIVILCLYLCDFAVFVSGFGGIIGAFAQSNGFNTGMFLAGCGIALIGAAILLFFGFTKVAQGMIFLSKKMALGIKRMFVGGKEK